MPRLPIIVSERGINTGTTGAQASPRDFYGGGLEAAAQGLGSVAGAALAVGRAKERDAVDDMQLGLNELQREAQEFISKNQDSTSLAIEFDQFYSRRANELGIKYGGELGKKWQVGVGNLYNSRQPSLLARTQDNANNKTIGVADSTIGTMVSSLSAVDGAYDDPYTIASQGFDSAVSHLETQTKGVAPTLVQKKREQYEDTVVFALLEKDVDSAKRFVGGKVPDPERRASLMARIEQRQATNRQAESIALTRDVQQSLFDVAKGESIAPVSVDRFMAAHGDADAAGELYKNYITEFRATQSAVGFARSAAGMSAPQAEAKMVAAIETAKTPTEQAALNSAYQSYLKPALRLQDENPDYWMRQYHPVASVAYSKVENAERALASAKERKADRLTVDMLEKNASAARFNYTAQSLAYQGFAPADAPQEQAATYLGLPTLQRQAMPSSTAKSIVQQIQSGDIQQARQTLDSVMSSYVDPTHRAIAWRDLVSAKLDPAYQAAWLNNDSWFADKLWASIRSKKSLELKEADRNNAVARIERTEEWRGLSEFLDATDREAEMPAWKDAILAFGAELGDFNKAAEYVIGEKLQPATINGAKMVIQKKYLPAGSDPNVSVQRMVNSLNRALAAPPVDDVDISSFVDAGYLPEGAEFNDERKRMVAQQIAENGTFFPNATGDGMELWILGRDNQPFQVRRKSDGLTWKVDIADAVANAAESKWRAPAAFSPQQPGSAPLRSIWRAGN